MSGHTSTWTTRISVNWSSHVHRIRHRLMAAIACDYWTGKRRTILLILATMLTTFSFFVPPSIPLINVVRVGYGEALLESNRTITILMWTDFFSKKLKEGPISQCPNQKCVLTHDRGLVDRSDAVVFHTRNIDWEDMPSNRSSDQNYVFLIWEAPPHTGGDFTSGWKKSYFNLTMTYRRDSDIYAPYGSIAKRQTPPRRNLTELMKKKRYLAAWMVSNCEAPSKRMELVNHLRKYIPVDIYGKCGMKHCKTDKIDGDTDPQACGNVFESNYKFYFALESNLCHDYVTEKLFLRLRRYLVPVVLERKNYEHYIPDYKKPWFIAADDFKSAKDLASYLLYLNGNDTAYYEYLSWHERYETVVLLNSDSDTISQDHWCQLCRAVGKKGKKAAWNAADWWLNGTCHTAHWA